MTKDFVWEEIQDKLQSISNAIEHGFNPTADEKKKILKARAKKLAQEPKQRNISGSIEVVEFILAHEVYGVELDFVLEVFPLTELTVIPCTPSFVVGVVNIRGQIFSIIDLKKFFKLPEKGITDIHKAIIIRTDDMELGILADNIRCVRTVFCDEIQHSLPALTGEYANYLRGITSDGLILLNVEKILSDKKIIIHEEV